MSYFKIEKWAGTRTFKIIDLGAAADLRVGINYIPKEFLLDPRYAFNYSLYEVDDNIFPVDTVIHHMSSVSKQKSLDSTSTYSHPFFSLRNSPFLRSIRSAYLPFSLSSIFWSIVIVTLE